MISDFTRRICARLCVDRAIEMEIARLKWKGDLLSRYGKLTPQQIAEDQRRHDDARVLFDLGDRANV